MGKSLRYVAVVGTRGWRCSASRPADAYAVDQVFGSCASPRPLNASPWDGKICAARRENGTRVHLLSALLDETGRSRGSAREVPRSQRDPRNQDLAPAYRSPRQDHREGCGFPAHLIKPLRSPANGARGTSQRRYPPTEFVEGEQLLLISGQETLHTGVGVRLPPDYSPLPPLAKGFVVLVTILDVATRRGMVWRLSNIPSTDYCIWALNEAITKYAEPEIFNADL